MKKILLFSLLLIILFIFPSPKNLIFAFPGQCCDIDSQCGAQEVCQGLQSSNCSTRFTCITSSSAPTPTIPSGLHCCSSTNDCPQGLVCDGQDQYCALSNASKPNHCVSPTPTPTLSATGLICCSDTVRCPGGWSCSEFAMGCVQVRNTSPNRCVEIIATPTPGGACWNECQEKKDCASGCECIMVTSNKGLCQPAKGGIRPSPCKVGGDNEGGIQTALGCIPTKNTTEFVGWLLKIAMGIGGGIAFLLIVFGAFQIITSSGNPESVKKGTEMITAAISGLIFIIFSLFLLKLIGVNILNIPGFGTP